MRPDWFPDWKGETCILIGAGPSAARENLEIARGRAKVIAVNESWRLAPWADVLYACDDIFWRAKQGVPEFSGLKISQDACAVARFPHLLKRVVCDKHRETLVLDKLGTIGWGGNSGFHALNLAVQFGARKIILVGYDMRLDYGLHWHGPHPKSMNNPTAKNVERWCRVIDDTAKALLERGIQVINCSPVSALKNFAKMPLAKALGETEAPKTMKLLLVGPELTEASQVASFGAVYSYYLRKELLARNIRLEFISRDEAKTLKPRDIDADHVIAFGTRYADRRLSHLAGKTKGALCQFADSPVRVPFADISFVIKGTSDGRNKVIGWAADPELCKPVQSRSVFKILIDHPDYVQGRGDISSAVIKDAERFKASSLWQGRYQSVEIEILGSPKNDSGDRTSYDELCKRYSSAHVFLLTHPESIGLSVIETATAGALPIVPKGFMDAGLLQSIRRIEYMSSIPWSLVLKKIDPQASRARAMKETWSNVADRMLSALREYRR